MEGAYEVAEIMFSDMGILENWLDAGDEWPHTLPATLVGWYLYEPKPAAEDIVGIPKVESRGGWWVVTFRIRRGKEMLAAFFNQHKDAAAVMNDDFDAPLGGIQLFCKECEKGLFLSWDSFGHMGGELVREAVSPENKDNSCTRKEASV